MNIAILSLAVVLGAGADPARVWLFDLGTKDSELRPGFTRITAKSVYSPQTGYGWKSTAGLKEHYQSYQGEWKFNESRGRADPPAIYANEITCDSVFGTQPATFLIDAPPGKYTAYLLCGRSAGSMSDYHWFDVQLGQAKATIKIPGAYRFERVTLEATVSGGPLAVEFLPKTDWLAACLIVFPADQAAKVRAEVIEPLEKEVYFLPPDVAAKWKESKHVDARPAPKLSAADQRRGFALFARHWSEIIYPNTVPRQHELDPTLRIFASLGEYEPVTFTMLPLRDLDGVRVEADDLRCGDAVIPKSQIDIRAVRYMLVRPNYSMFNAYHIAPDVLEHRNGSSIRQGENQRFWITVHVPDDARPGVYRGQVAIRPAKGEAAALPLVVRVLPIRLQKNPEHIYGMYYRDPLSSIDPRNTPEANAYFQRKAELERQDMVAHGMNSHTSHASGVKREADGRYTMDGEETERRIALDRKYGLADKPLITSIPVSGPYATLVDRRGMGSHLRLVPDEVPQAYFDEVTKIVDTIEKERQRRGWPEFLYYPIDEPSTTAASVKFMTRILQAVKRVPGVRSYITADPTHEQFEPLWPFVDVWCCQPFVWDFDKIKRLSREKKTEFWCYPNHISGENDHTPVRGARMTFGYGFWKSGFRTLVPWIYQSSGGDTWNYLDSSSMDFGNRSTPDGEPIPVTLWEAFREGIDDGRYIYTLEQLAAAGRKQGGRAAALAAEAEQELQTLWKSFVAQEKYKYDDLWSGRDFDARRWVLAERILQLQEVVGK